MCMHTTFSELNIEIFKINTKAIKVVPIYVSRSFIWNFWPTYPGYGYIKSRLNYFIAIFYLHKSVVRF